MDTSGGRGLRYSATPVPKRNCSTPAISTNSRPGRPRPSRPRPRPRSESSEIGGGREVGRARHDRVAGRPRPVEIGQDDIEADPIRGVGGPEKGRDPAPRRPAPGLSNGTPRGRGAGYRPAGSADRGAISGGAADERGAGECGRLDPTQSGPKCRLTVTRVIEPGNISRQPLKTASGSFRKKRCSTSDYRMPLQSSCPSLTMTGEITIIIIGFDAFLNGGRKARAMLPALLRWIGRARVLPEFPAG